MPEDGFDNLKEAVYIGITRANNLPRGKGVLVS